jgi:hypothetical protein
MWQYTGEGAEEEGATAVVAAEEEVESPTVMQKVAPTLELKLESAQISSEMPSPMELNLDVTADVSQDEVGDGEERKSAKKKKKKKKFVVRQRERLEGGEVGSPSVPFYLAASGNMTPKQQKQMEDLLLGGSGADPKDGGGVVNPMHRPKGSIEKKKQRGERKKAGSPLARMKPPAAAPPAEAKQEEREESKTGDVKEEEEEEIKSDAGGDGGGNVHGAPPMAPALMRTGSPGFVSPPLGLPPLSQMASATRKKPLPPITKVMSKKMEDVEIEEVKE